MHLRWPINLTSTPLISFLSKQWWHSSSLFSYLYNEQIITPRKEYRELCVLFECIISASVVYAKFIFYFAIHINILHPVNTYVLFYEKYLQKWPVCTQPVWYALYKTVQPRSLWCMYVCTYNQTLQYYTHPWSITLLVCNN